MKICLESKVNSVVRVFSKY